MRAAALHEIGQEKLEVLDDIEAVGCGPGPVRIRTRAPDRATRTCPPWAGSSRNRRRSCPATTARARSSKSGKASAVFERLRVQAKFDSKQDDFTYDELDALLTPHYARRPTGETFAAAEVLGLQRSRRATARSPY